MLKTVLSRFELSAIALAVGVASLASAHAADGPPVPHPKPKLVAQVAATETASETASDASPLPPPAPADQPAPTDELPPSPTVVAAVRPHERPEARIGDSGLPVPRFVSLKSGEVYLREGPSPQHKVQWVYVRRGLPVEVIAEYDVWRRIRDADGVVGWVHKGMLDGRRSVLFTGSDNAPLREQPSAQAPIMAYAQPGVVAKLKSCNETYCEVQAQSIDAYVSRDRIWGVYASETVD